MNTVFAHYLPSHTLRQVLFDAFLLFAIMLASALLLVPLGNEHWLKIAPSALIFSVLMVGLNTALGLYRPFFDAGNRVVFARIALSLLISIPVAYGVIVLLPWAEMSLQSLHVVAVLPLVALLMVRAIVNQRSNACLFSRRVMIIGTGEDAARVHADLNKPLMRGAYVVGFMAAGGDEGMAVDPDKILPEQSLLEAVRRYKVSEIVVGVRERRGGVLPLRELLDCKLAGVRVLDLTTFFRAGARPGPTGFAACQLADLWRWLPAESHPGFRQTGVRHCRCLHPAGAGSAGDAAHHAADPAGGWSACVLPSGAGWSGRTHVPRHQVPQHAPGCGEGRQAALGDGQ